MIKKVLLGLSVTILIFSCNTKEKTRLQSKVDSLSTELKVSQEIAVQMNEVEVLIDSIDASRHLLRVNVVEGTSYENYAKRLNSINQYVKDTQLRISSLEEKSKASTRGMSSTIKRLKKDLEIRTKELEALQLEVSKLRSENKMMAEAIAKKDSTLLAKEGVIKVREADIASLETKMRLTNDENKASTADLYFVQALVWEKVAERTHFAPRKKKQARREALDLYKIAWSLGRQDAQEKIKKLEDDLS
jgi:hypothetical protein